MNNEILERVKKHYVLDEIQDNLLLDYITNLQQEIERLKDFNIKLQATKDRLDKYDKENTLRIDKAIEYIKLRKQICERQENTTGTNILVELENILRGDKE